MFHISKHIMNLQGGLRNKVLSLSMTHFSKSLFIDRTQQQWRKYGSSTISIHSMKSKLMLRRTGRRRVTSERRISQVNYRGLHNSLQ